MDATMTIIVVALDQDHLILSLVVVGVATIEGTQDQGRRYSASAAGIAGDVGEGLLPTQRSMTAIIVDGVGLRIPPLAVTPHQIDAVVAILHTLPIALVTTHRLRPPAVGARHRL